MLSTNLLNTAPSHAAHDEASTATAKGPQASKTPTATGVQGSRDVSKEARDARDLVCDLLEAMQLATQGGWEGMADTVDNLSADVLQQTARKGHAKAGRIYLDQFLRMPRTSLARAVTWLHDHINGTTRTTDISPELRMLLVDEAKGELAAEIIEAKRDGVIRPHEKKRIRKKIGPVIRHLTALDRDLEAKSKGAA